MSTTLKTALFVIGTFLGVLIATTVLHWASAPGRVVSRTLDTDNVITSYERFHDLNANFTARVGMVRDLSAQLATTPQGDRDAQLTDLNTARQSCREIAAAYNADAGKLNKVVFQDRALPAHLDPALCEGARP